MASFRNKVCPFCGSKKIRYLLDLEEEEKYYNQNENFRLFFKKEGRSMICAECDYVFREKRFYEEYANRGRTPIDREDYLFDLGEKCARLCGQENAMYYTLMYKYMKEHRDVYYKEYIEVDFAKMMKRVNAARRRKY